MVPAPATAVSALSVPSVEGDETSVEPVADMAGRAATNRNAARPASAIIFRIIRNSSFSKISMSRTERIGRIQTGPKYFFDGLKGEWLGSVDREDGEQ